MNKHRFPTKIEAAIEFGYIFALNCRVSEIPTFEEYRDFFERSYTYMVQLKGNQRSIPMAKEKKQPAAKFRIGYVTATVWHNDDKFYNVVLARSYKDGDEWRETDQLGHADVVCAIRALQRAEEFIAAQ